MTDFPGALQADRARYVPTTMIRERLEAAGFTKATTEIAQHIPAETPFNVATEHGLTDRRSTSQLMVISHAESRGRFAATEGGATDAQN